MATPAIKVTHLSCKIGENSLVDDLSYQFFPGQVYSIVGPSGAGKSSFLRLLNRLNEPSSGEIEIDGIPYQEIPPTELRRKVCYLLQNPVLFESNIRDNFRIADPTISDEKIIELLAWCAAKKLTPDQAVERLSVGEAQRVAIGRLLACDPKVALLDEPTSALDPTATVTIEKLIRHLATERNLAVLVVTHDPEQAVRIGGEALLMVAGKLIECGAAEQLIKQPTTPEGQAFRDRELT